MTESRRTAATSERESDLREAHESHWWRWDRLDALWWALVFAWGALVLIAGTTSLSDDLDWWDGSGVFLIGAGSLALIGIPIRMAVRQYRSKLGWTLLWGTLLLALGLGEVAGRAWHALPLVAVAGLIISGTFHTGTRGERRS